MARPEPIRIYDRRKRTHEEERIYGERWLAWAYGTAPGRASVELLVKRRLFSLWYGWRMRKRLSATRVIPFIVEYDLDIDVFVKSPYEFSSFNDFFVRRLKPEARPIAGDENMAVLPADGRHLVFPVVDAATGFYAKGQRFDLAALLGGGAEAEPFAGGALVISRLCPVDYHRFHFPVSGVPAAPQLINGPLYSVSPIALRRNLRYLWENKRTVTRLASPHFGEVAIVAIGATNVGSIVHNYDEGRPVTKGAGMGWFQFGGSCLATVFQRGRIRFDADLVEQSARQIETYARMGESLGVAG